MVWIPGVVWTKRRLQLQWRKRTSGSVYLLAVHLGQYLVNGNPAKYGKATFFENNPVSPWAVDVRRAAQGRQKKIGPGGCVISKNVRWTQTIGEYPSMLNTFLKASRVTISRNVTQYVSFKTIMLVRKTSDGKKKYQVSSLRPCRTFKEILRLSICSERHLKLSWIVESPRQRLQKKILFRELLASSFYFRYTTLKKSIVLVQDRLNRK